MILKTPVSSTKLNESVRNAWIRLRYYAPLIGICTRKGEIENDLVMTYESSKNSDVATKWANDTIKWDQKEKTLDVSYQEVLERWWGSEGRWNMEMHVGTGTEGRLHFM